MNAMCCTNSMLLAPSSSAAYIVPSTSNLVNYYDAISSTMTISSGNVSSWSDLSGNGYNATQSNVAIQPSYSSTGLNSKPTIVFTGNTSVRLDMASANIAAGGEFTVAIVASCNFNNGFTNRLLTTAGQNANVDFRYFLFSGNSALSFVTSNSTVVSGTPVSFTYGQPAVFMTIGKLTSSNPVYVNYINYTNLTPSGQTTLQLRTTFSSVDMYSMSIGGWNNSLQTNQTFNGPISSVMVYNKALSDTERITLFNSLKSRYNISV